MDLCAKGWGRSKTSLLFLDGLYTNNGATCSGARVRLTKSQPIALSIIRCFVIFVSVRPTSKTPVPAVTSTIAWPVRVKSRSMKCLSRILRHKLIASRHPPSCAVLGSPKHLPSEEFGSVHTSSLQLSNTNLPWLESPAERGDSDPQDSEDSGDDILLAEPPDLLINMSIDGLWGIPEKLLRLNSTFSFSRGTFHPAIWGKFMNPLLSNISRVLQFGRVSFSKIVWYKSV
mmetsp:Transcript_30248/g.48131  ORF Transcript_30248/g.48131 Transcript_30248/m.48131 type:complete len:230 (-) Transcript_30248:1291-1980(-)